MNAIFHFPPGDDVLHHARAPRDRWPAVHHAPIQSPPSWRRFGTTVASWTRTTCRSPWGRRSRTWQRTETASASRATPAGPTAPERPRSACAARGAWSLPPATTTTRTESTLPVRSFLTSAHYYDDPHPFYRKRVVVVGGKNSAAIAALELYRAGATVTLVHRRDALSEKIKYWIRPDIQNRIKEGSVAARFETTVVEITSRVVVVEGPGGREELPADAVFLLTGYHPEPELLRRLGCSRRRRDAEAGARPDHVRDERSRRLHRRLDRFRTG